jgi:cellulose synthase/poly-beta-1,6-N-acetylglucosamine synthase-like glycosyltransferase
LYTAALAASALRMLWHQWPLAFHTGRRRVFKRRPSTGKILIQYPVMDEPLHLVKRFVASLQTIPAEHRHRFVLQVCDDYRTPLDPSLFDDCCLETRISRRKLRTGRDPRNPGRARSKAGNLNHGLLEAGPGFAYVAIFDADHQVRDYGAMVDACDMLAANPGLWCVQSRWVMANLSPWSPLQILQEASMGAHVDREQTAKSADRGDALAIMNGAGAVMDLRYIRERFGFWLERAVTEDLDISYCAHRCGKKVLVRSEWETLVDNPETWDALRQQWKKWSQANGQLFRHHLKEKHPDTLRWLTWLSWLSGFAWAPLKYVFAAVWAARLCSGAGLGVVEALCVIPHVVAWFAACQTWDGRLKPRMIWAYPLQYVLEFGILATQVRGFWQGFFTANQEIEFNPTPKK